MDDSYRQITSDSGDIETKNYKLFAILVIKGAQMLCALIAIIMEIIIIHKLRINKLQKQYIQITQVLMTYIICAQMIIPVWYRVNNMQCKYAFAYLLHFLTLMLTSVYVLTWYLKNSTSGVKITIRVINLLLLIFSLAAMWKF